ncbi:MAG: hypothetical protein FWD86_00390 [Firmicutes bacterium]|nr:hypothetical protein [Bacillota bacterium]
MKKTTIRDCCIKAAQNLGLDALSGRLKDGAEGEGEGRAFLSHAKAVIEEIASSFFAFKRVKKIDIYDGEFELCQFDCQVLQILSVVKNKAKQRFCVLPDRVLTEASGLSEIEYSYLPKIDSLEDDIPFLAKVTARTIGFGIAAEYCIVNGLPDAVMWDKRYKDELAAATANRRPLKVAKRRWL